MLRYVFSLISACLLLTACAAAAAANHSGPTEYANLPLSFEANVGQTDARVSYLGRSVFFTDQGATLKLPLPGGGYLAVAMKFEGGRRSATITAESPLLGRSNYLIGRNRTR